MTSITVEILYHLVYHDLLDSTFASQISPGLPNNATPGLFAEAYDAGVTLDVTPTHACPPKSVFTSIRVI